MPDLHGISLVTADGQVQFLTLLPFGSKRFPAADAEAVRALFETGHPVVSEPFQSPINKKNLVTSVGVPVIRNGKVIYCMRAIFLNSSLNALLAAQHLPSDWTSAVLSRTGLIQARSRFPEQFVGKPASTVVLQALASQRHDVFDSLTKEGNAVKTVIVRVPGWDWHLVVGVPSSKFEAPLNQVIWFLSVFGLATLALGGILVSWAGFWRQEPYSESQFSRGSALSMFNNIWPSALALAVALAIGTLSTNASQSALNDIRDLTDRRRVINNERRDLFELLSAYTDIESGQRGFVITGDDTFLAPYFIALSKIPLLTNVLRSELERAEITDFSWSDLASVSSQRLAAAAKGIDLRRQRGPNAIHDVDFFEHGKMLMDKLRFMLGNLASRLDVETQRINDTITAQEQKTRQLQWLAQFAVGALVLLSISIWLYERRRRQHALFMLQKVNETLEVRVATRTLDLSLANERIRHFTMETEAIVDSERKRLSREVHDQIGQIFTGLKMIARTLKPGSMADDQHQAMMGAIESGVKISRRIAAELRPPLLDDFGIRAALEHYLKTTFEPLEIAFDLQFPKKSRLHAQQKNQLFRMVQEACTNVIRHAQARQVDVIGRTSQHGLEVRIEDDGIGFDPTLVRADALGLIGIEERAKLCGAAFSVQAREGGGTCVAIRFPAQVLEPELAT
jgi:signal transduction histidine kinase